jgi:hypothetical protein
MNIKSPIYIIILTFITILNLSCGRDALPVLEVYVTFKNTQPISSISIKPQVLEYGRYDKQEMKPASTGRLDIERDYIYIQNEKLETKTFITSKSDWFYNIGYLTLSCDMFINEGNTRLEGGLYNLFQVDFNPENGEAYEVNFIIDVNNSIKKKDNSFYFELGGDSKVVITKY